MKKNNETLLIEILAKNNNAMTEEELASILDIRLNTVRATLGKLVKERKIRRAGGGKFCLVSKNKRR